MLIIRAPRWTISLQDRYCKWTFKIDVPDESISTVYSKICKLFDSKEYKGQLTKSNNQIIKELNNKK